MKKGFTLIELLVVMSIISLLSSIILVSLKGAREKANDAVLIQEMNQLRTIAFQFNGDYSNSSTIKVRHGNCNTLFDPIGSPLFNSTDFKAQLLAAADASSGSINNALCALNKTYWLVVMPLRSDPSNKSYCVNSLNESKMESKYWDSFGSTVAGDSCDLAATR